MKKHSEADIAAALVAHLEDAGHDVYQEVEYRGAIIDIVSVTGPEVWAIETKLTWSLDLLTQCVERKNLVHRVFAAVPVSKTDHSRLFAELGIGSYVVSMGGRYGGYGDSAPYVEMRHRPSRTTPRSFASWPRELKARLGPGYKTHAKAGSPNGAGRWTPFRETCERVAYEVKKNPGITLKELIDGMNHHYTSAASARSSIRKWIELKKVPGVEGRVEEGKLRLYPSAPA
jgi:hypothetical protein